MSDPEVLGIVRHVEETHRPKEDDDYKRLVITHLAAWQRKDLKVEKIGDRILISQRADEKP